MNRRLSITMFVMLVLVAVSMVLATRATAPVVADTGDGPGGVVDANMLAQPAAASDPLVLSYAAKFVCTEALGPGQVSFNAVAPIVQEKTEVVIHNPSAFPVVFYKKAVIAPIEAFGQPDQGVPPGKWKEVKLNPDYSFRINCDDIAKLLNDDPGATFAGKYGIGVTVEGYVVLAIGPQPNAAGANTRFSPLDVTAQYVRSSEVLKKDIHYQPWWNFWWWPLPWRLGYAYHRILPVDPASLNANLDCRRALYDALKRDAQAGSQPDATVAALEAGSKIDPTTVMELSEDTPAALVALVGRCEHMDPQTLQISYVLVSNKGSTDSGPMGSAAEVSIAVPYPWIPGRWYDTTVVIPQNANVDIDQFFHNWQAQRWVDAGANRTDVDVALRYYFPYWCGWGRWYWWWNGGGCVDIGVGEGESMDVEQIMPVRLMMPQWPPALN